MKSSLAALALSTGMLAASTALAAENELPIMVTTPVFAQLVSYTLPQGFKGAFSDASESFYIQEAVPAGESVEKWSEMITMMGMRDLATSADQPLAAAAENIRANYQRACPGTLSAQSFGASTTDGRETLTVFLGCGSVTTPQGKVSETVVIVFIKGQSDVYALQWAAHADAQSSPPVYNVEIWSSRMAQLTPIRICDRIEGEGVPYPSCIFKK